MIARKQAWFVCTFPFPRIHGNQQYVKIVQKKEKENGGTLGRKEQGNIKTDITHLSKDINRGFNNDQDRNSN